MAYGIWSLRCLVPSTRLSETTTSTTENSSPLSKLSRNGVITSKAVSNQLKSSPIIKTSKSFAMLPNFLIDKLDGPNSLPVSILPSSISPAKRRANPTPYPDAQTMTPVITTTKTASSWTHPCSPQSKPYRLRLKISISCLRSKTVRSMIKRSSMSIATFWRHRCHQPRKPCRNYGQSKTV